MANSIELIVATNVRVYRARLRISQLQLADKAGISQAYVAKIEAGKGNITLEVLDRVASALGIGAETLISQFEAESTSQAAEP